MKAIHWITTAAALAFVQTAPSSAAGGRDTEVLIYRFPGVLTGFHAARNATVFHCTNFSGETETIRFVTRDENGNLLQNDTLSINHLGTRTAVTRDIVAYAINLNLATGSLRQGTTAIAATSTNIICTAMTIEALVHNPIGVALRGIRFNPAPGSQE